MSGCNYNPNLPLAISLNLGYNISKLLSYCVNPYFITLILLKAEHFGVIITLSTKFSDIKDLTVWLGRPTNKIL